MKSFSLITALTIVLMSISIAMAAPGYKRDPIGGKTWQGGGRAPHLSPRVPPSRPDVVIPRPPLRPGKPVDPGYGVRPPHHGGGYLRPKPHRRYFGGTKYRYYDRGRVETIVREREVVPIYVPAPQKSKIRCAGDPVTSRDPKTGVLTMTWTNGAKRCK